MDITPEALEAVREMVQAKSELWTASTRLEAEIDQDINSDGEALSSFVACYHDGQEISDETAANLLREMIHEMDLANGN